MRNLKCWWRDWRELAPKCNEKISNRTSTLPIYWVRAWEVGEHECWMVRELDEVRKEKEELIDCHPFSLMISWLTTIWEECTKCVETWEQEVAPYIISTLLPTASSSVPHMLQFIPPSCITLKWGSLERKLSQHTSTAKLMIITICKN